MPRQRKTQTGAAAQPSTPVPGQTYGLGVEQQRLAEAMPAPSLMQHGRDREHAGMNGQSAPTVAPSSTVAEHMGINGQDGTPTNADDSNSIAAAMAQAKAMQPDAGLLSLPTQRPNEPVTHGLASGPGAGPEALGRAPGSPVGKWMRDISRASGNPYLQQLADRLGA